MVVIKQFYVKEKETFTIEYKLTHNTEKAQCRRKQDDDMLACTLFSKDHDLSSNLSPLLWILPRFLQL